MPTIESSAKKQRQQDVAKSLREHMLQATTPQQIHGLW